jgi:hypothetical protein
VGKIAGNHEGNMKTPTGGFIFSQLCPVRDLQMSIENRAKKFVTVAIFA